MEGNRPGADLATRPAAIRSAESKIRIGSAGSSLPISRAKARPPRGIPGEDSPGKAVVASNDGGRREGLVLFSGVSNPRNATLWEFFSPQQVQARQ
jgi:hypothetical protein